MRRSRRSPTTTRRRCSRTSRPAGTTEIDYLNGGIVRFGDEHGVPTPLNRAIWSLVKGLEQSW